MNGRRCSHRITRFPRRKLIKSLILRRKLLLPRSTGCKFFFPVRFSPVKSREETNPFLAAVFSRWKTILPTLVDCMASEITVLFLAIWLDVTSLLGYLCAPVSAKESNQSEKSSMLQPPFPTSFSLFWSSLARRSRALETGLSFISNQISARYN